MVDFVIGMGIVNYKAPHISQNYDIWFLELFEKSIDKIILILLFFDRTGQDKKKKHFSTTLIKIELRYRDLKKQH